MIVTYFIILMLGQPPLDTQFSVYIENKDLFLVDSLNNIQFNDDELNSIWKRYKQISMCEKINMFDSLVNDFRKNSNKPDELLLYNYYDFILLDESKSYIIDTNSIMKVYLSYKEITDNIGIDSVLKYFITRNFNRLMVSKDRISLKDEFNSSKSNEKIPVNITYSTYIVHLKKNIYWNVEVTTSIYYWMYLYFYKEIGNLMFENYQYQFFPNGGMRSIYDIEYLLACDKQLKDRLIYVLKQKCLCEN